MQKKGNIVRLGMVNSSRFVAVHTSQFGIGIMYLVQDILNAVSEFLFFGLNSNGFLKCGLFTV